MLYSKKSRVGEDLYRGHYQEFLSHSLFAHLISLNRSYTLLTYWEYLEPESVRRYVQHDAYNRPQTTDRKLAEDKPEEQGNCLLMRLYPAVSQYRPLNDPTNKNAKPDVIHVLTP